MWDKNGKKILQKILVGVASVLMLSSLSGCFDLGGFLFPKSSSTEYEDISEHDTSEYYKEYYNSFGSVFMTCQNSDGTEVETAAEYGLEKALFNKASVQDLRSWQSNDDAVSSKDYMFLSVEVKKELEIESISLFMRGEKDAVMHIYAFVMNEFDASSEDLCPYQTDLYERDGDGNIKKDGSGNDIRKEFDVPDTSTAVAEATCNMSPNSWSSFTMTFVKKGSKDLTTPLDIDEGKIVVLLFENNIGYGREKGYNRMSFRVANLLVRVKEND